MLRFDEEETMEDDMEDLNRSATPQTLSNLLLLTRVQLRDLDFKGAQGLGIGCALTRDLESIGVKWKVSKVMLAVLKSE